MSIEQRKIGISALLTDPFIQEARSRTIWAANTCSACGDLGVRSALLGSGSATPIDFLKNPLWLKKEISRFYGVSELDLMPTFSPNKHWKKSPESFVYDFYVKTTLLPHLTDVHTRDPILAHRAIEAGKGVIFEDHDEDVQAESRMLISELSHSKNFKAVVCITEKIKSYYSNCPVDEKKLIVADSGVQDFSETFRQKSKSLNQLLESGMPTIGYAGGLQPERDVDAIFEAAKKLPHFKFILIGGRQQLVDQLLDKATALNVHNIDFLGYLKSQDMRSILEKRCDVLLYSRARGYSTENSSPLKLFEYLNYGKPIVSADTTVTSRYFGINGIFKYEPSSVDSLTSALQSAYDFSRIQNVDVVAFRDLLKEKCWSVRQRKILEFAGVIL